MEILSPPASPLMVAVNIADWAAAIEGGMTSRSGNEWTVSSSCDQVADESGDGGSSTRGEVIESGASQPVPLPGGSRACNSADGALQEPSQTTKDSQASINSNLSTVETRSERSSNTNTPTATPSSASSEQELINFVIVKR